MPVLPPIRSTGDFADLVTGLGVLTWDIAPELVDAAVEAAGVREKRRRCLPAVAVVYAVLGLCLMSGADSRQPPGYLSVLRAMTEGAAERLDLDVVLPTRQGFTKARQRLGCKPFELLFDAVRGPVAEPGTPGAFAFGRRLVSWDGTAAEVPDTPENAAAFGVHADGGPQLRLVTLIECGTHALLDAAFDGYGGLSEQALARGLIHALGPGMLLLADRAYPGWEMWGLAAGTGADLLWRARGNLRFTVIKELPDGSYLSVMPTPAENKRLGQARWRGRVPAGIPEGHRIRVIEYTVTARTATGFRTERYRLVTTLLDHREAPAAELAALYRQRWESENTYSELKTRLRGAGFTFRSKTPELACQEMTAFLIVYQALCALRARAAATAGLDPDQVSFTLTLRTARERLIRPPLPGALASACARAIATITSTTLGPRRDRQAPRARKPRRKNFPDKKRKQPQPACKVTYTITLTPPAHSP